LTNFAADIAARGVTHTQSVRMLWLGGHTEDTTQCPAPAW